MARKPIGRVVLIIVLGALVGSLLGQLIALIIPAGVVQEFFLKSAPLELGPTTINVGFFALTLGFKITFNVVGFLGVAIAIYFLRWYY